MGTHSSMEPVYITQPYQQHKKLCLGIDDIRNFKTRDLCCVFVIVCTNLLVYLGETSTKSGTFGLDTQLYCNSNTPYKWPALCLQREVCNTTVYSNTSSMQTACLLLLLTTR